MFGAMRALPHVRCWPLSHPRYHLAARLDLLPADLPLCLSIPGIMMLEFGLFFESWS
jgi:hypothetical protein